MNLFRFLERPRSGTRPPQLSAYAACLTAALAAACASPGDSVPRPAGGTSPAAPVSVSQGAPAAVAAPASTASPTAAPTHGASSSGVPTAVVDPRDLVPPTPIRFEDAVARAGQKLFADARRQLGGEPRLVVVDPLVDANTGAQTVSSAQMGTQLESLLKTQQAGWALAPLTRQSLAERPLLLIGTLTPVNVERAVDTPPDAFRIWLSLIDLRTGRIVAKNIDRATVNSVNPEPLKYYSDSPTWHKDKTVAGYINSCQINTRIGDSADPDYLSRLPAAAVVNEATIAYGAGRIPEAQRLYREASTLADPGDLRVLNGLYLTSWQLGQRDEARQAFGKIVSSGLELKRLPVKLLFQPGRTSFNTLGDLPQQYGMWINALAEQTGQAAACVRIVGHTSRTGSASVNERLSRQRAEAVQRMLEGRNRTLGTRLSASGVGSREALVGLGTDDQRDALDRRVEFRVVDCI